MDGRFVAVLVVGAVMALLSGCSERDKVVDVHADDLEMNAAIAKARDTLPTFWRVFEKLERGESNFELKVKVTDRRGIEHLWATDIERRGNKTMGTINNDPNTVTSVKLGDRIEIPEADISGWLYVRDGKVVGNYTVRPLFKKMSATEVERIKKMLADE